MWLKTMTEDLQKIKDRLRKDRFAGQTFTRLGQQDVRVYYSYSADNASLDTVFIRTVSRTEFEQEEQIDFTPEEIEQIFAFVKKAKKAANSNRRADARTGEEG